MESFYLPLFRELKNLKSEKKAFLDPHEWCSALKKSCTYAREHFENNDNNYGVIGSVGTLCTALLYGDIKKFQVFSTKIRISTL